MSNMSFSLIDLEFSAAAFVADNLRSAHAIAAHIPFRGVCRDLRERTETRRLAIAEFESLRGEILSVIATVLWQSEGDHLVETAFDSLAGWLGRPTLQEFLRVSAHWRGNPDIGVFHEHAARYVQSIIARDSSEVVGHARTL